MLGFTLLWGQLLKLDFRGNCCLHVKCNSEGIEICAKVKWNFIIGTNYFLLWLSYNCCCLQAFAQLLQAPQDDAQLIIRDRFPVPRLVVCDQHGSQVHNFSNLLILSHKPILFISLSSYLSWYIFYGESCIADSSVRSMPSDQL